MRCKRANRRKTVRVLVPRKPIDLKAPIMASVGLAALIAAVAGLGTVLDRPIERVVVEGPFQRVTAMQIRSAVAKQTRGGFLSVDLEAIHSAVAGLAWVDRVRIQRSWPDGVRVIVTEQVAAARWREHRLLNTRGEVFDDDTRNVLPELPSLSGPEGTETQVARRFLSLSRKLLGVGLRVRALKLDARGAWDLELDNGLILKLGRDQTDRRLDRFVDTILPLIETQIGRIDYVDLRYAHGFAIGWREGESESLLAGTGDLSDV